MPHHPDRTIAKQNIPHPTLPHQMKLKVTPHHNTQYRVKLNHIVSHTPPY